MLAWLRRVLSVFMVMSLLTMGFAAAMPTEQVYANGIKSKISSNTKELDSEVDKAGGAFVDTVRGIAIVIIVVLVLWIAITLLGSGNSQGIAAVKYRAVGLVLAIILAFKTEAVVSAIFGIIGYTPK